MSLQQTMGNGHHGTKKPLLDPKMKAVTPKPSNASSWEDKLSSLQPSKELLEDSIRKHPALAVTIGLAIGSVIAVAIKRWRK